MAAMLPKLFFVHFRDTSFVAEDDGALAGFLCGFRSQTFADEAYIHFVGVDPATRGSGLGRTLYERFFAAVAPRTIVRAVTSPVNERSVAFHQALGFEVERDRPRVRRRRRAARPARQAPGLDPFEGYGRARRRSDDADGGCTGLPGAVRRTAGGAAALARRLRAAPG